MLQIIYITLTLLFELVNTQEVCAFNLTIPGKCVCLEKCDYAVKVFKNGGKPQICYFQDDYPIVCCPQQLQGIKEVNDLSIAATQCKEIKKLYKLKLRGHVLGGTRAQTQEYVHMALLGYGKNIKAVEWLCGGSLISNRYILTAAHCLNSLEHGPLKWVRLGELDLEKINEDANPIDFKVKTLIKHPDYSSSSKYNDIALVELETAVNYTDYIKPACIHSGKMLGNKNFYATGWGLISLNSSKSGHLQEVELKLFSEGECKAAYENKRMLSDGIVSTQLCAGGRGSTIKDTCAGDSGGPLQYSNNEADGYRGYTVFGITSFGKACGVTNSPGVYTRVSSFVPWIESIVWPN